MMFVEAESPTFLSRRLAAPATARRVNWLRLLLRLQPYFYLLPAIATIGLWVYWPLVGTFRLSFFQWNLNPNTARVAVGFANYHSVATLPEMKQAIVNTLIYVVGLVPFSVVLPLAIAILIADLGGRIRSIYRAIIFLPVLMAPVVVGVIWLWLLHPTQGLVNDVSGPLGLGHYNVFRSTSQAIWVIILITGWKHLGFSVLLFSAGLTNISRDYMEAASMDGASRWQTVRYITLPLLSPTIMFTALLTILLSAQWTFPLINVLTQGGPLGSTTNVYYMLWQYGFHNFNIGFSSAAAVVFFLAFGLVALVFLKVMDRFSFYDE